MKPVLNNLAKAANLYFTGRLENPQKQEQLNLRDYYNQTELDELEIDTDSEKQAGKFSNSILQLKADWDSFDGSLNNSTAGIFDALFSSIGTEIAQKTNFTQKLLITGLSLGSSLLGSKFRIPILSKEFSFFQLGGRLLRAPLHIFDSIFSVIGETWSKSPAANLVTLALTALGFNKTVKEKLSIDLPYQTVAGSLGRSALHYMQSLCSSTAQNLFQLFPRAAGIGTFALSFALSQCPEKVLEKNIPWQDLAGLLSRNLFNFIDSLYSALGQRITQGFKNMDLKSRWGFSAALSGLIFGSAVFKPVRQQAKDLFAYKVPFSKFEGRLIRAILHLPETLAFNLGTEFANSKLGLLASPLALIAGAFNSLKSKPLLPNLKVPMANIGGLIGRLPFNFLESLLSATSLRLSKFIPKPLLLAFGPMISYQLGQKFKQASTQFNESNSLILKHCIHFWDNLLSTAAYGSAKKFISSGDGEKISGSLLSDGRWLSSDGRIIPNMAIGKQLA